MEKLRINGKDYTTIDEIAYAVHKVRRDADDGKLTLSIPDVVLSDIEKRYCALAAKKAIDLFVKTLYDEELSDKRLHFTDKMEIIEMEGRYVIARMIKTAIGTKVEYVQNYSGRYVGEKDYGEHKYTPFIIEDYDGAKVFYSEREANEIAKNLGSDDWYVIDVSDAALRRTKNVKELIQAIFRDEEEDDDDYTLEITWEEELPEDEENSEDNKPKEG